MTKLILRFSNVSILVALFAMIGCSSSGGGGDSAPGSSSAVNYSGVSLPSAINAANAESVTTAAGEAVQQGANTLSSPRPLGVDTAGSSDMIVDLSTNLASAMASSGSVNLPSGISMNGSCGGRVDIPDSQVNDFSATSGPVSFTMTFFQYCDASVGGQYTIDGQVSFNYLDIADPNSGFTIDYNGVTVDDGSGPITINMTIDCSDMLTCTLASDYVGNDGTTIYRVADIDFTGNETTGFNGTAKFYHPGHGSVTITATGVTFGNCGSFPDGGSVSATGTPGSAQIDFNGDCTYSIAYDDGAGNAGIIDGSFI